MEAWMEQIRPYFDYHYLSQFAIQFSIGLITAFFVFFVGRWIALKIEQWLRRGMLHAHVDPTLASFLSSIVYTVMLVVVVVVSINQLGVQTTSIAAMIAAAGLAIGLALQGSLSNFAAGVLIILNRPFQLGDLITTTDTKGRIEEITMFTTTVRTAQNLIVVIPNSRVTGDRLINFSRKPRRRVDLEIPVSYEADYDKVKRLISQEIKKIDGIHADPAPAIKVAGLNPYGAVIGVEVWVLNAQHDPTQEALYEGIWKALKKEKVPLLTVPGWAVSHAA